MEGGHFLALGVGGILRINCVCIGGLSKGIEVKFRIVVGNRKF